MIANRNSIFRDKALKHYTLGKRKDVLPNFSSIPVRIFLWILLALMAATGFMAWYIQIPVYATGPGLVLGTGTGVSSQENQAIAVGFFSPATGSQLRAGQSVQIQLDGGQMVSTVLEVEPGTNSPVAVLAHYGIASQSTPASTQPEIVAYIDLGTNFPVALYKNSALALQVKVGSQALYSALMA